MSTARPGCGQGRHRGGLASTHPDSGGEIPHAQPARDGSLADGPNDLRRLFDGYTEVELRAMNGDPADGLFGVPFLLTGLFRR
ncbi:hypothetical protein [Amycolatopsis sp.]|uniref:hypothetical protein n=1 Tax=Amycolatopsis sp. TaxID=37632 RepID=UPI002D80E8D1|nr:hypothetical protein [Amycolatopsis sp.]HET6704689.1 hypothetical protein [Amycolatopsis sp.]